jgi:predicted metal-dependent HD superfamily phosphohydrolase
LSSTIGIDEANKRNLLVAEEITIIVDCILATKVPQKPENLLQQIMCDADLLYLAEANMIERSNLLRREWATILNKTYTDKEWYELNIQFLTSHTFHTKYCRDQFDSFKWSNIKKLIVKLEELANDTFSSRNNIAA